VRKEAEAFAASANGKSAATEGTSGAPLLDVSACFVEEADGSARYETRCSEGVGASAAVEAGEEISSTLLQSSYIEAAGEAKQEL
jgi:hypothetical protein